MTPVDVDDFSVVASTFAAAVEEAVAFGLELVAVVGSLEVAMRDGADVDEAATGEAVLEAAGRPRTASR